MGVGGWGRARVSVEGCGVSRSSPWQPSILYIQTPWCHTPLLVSQMMRSSFFTSTAVALLAADGESEITLAVKMVIDKTNSRALIAETCRQKESSFCTLLRTWGGWLKPDKVQMELLGSVMRFPECMFGLGDYRLRLPPRSLSHTHGHRHLYAHAHTNNETLSIRLPLG